MIKHQQWVATCAILVALFLATPGYAVAPGATKVNAFTLSKVEAAKGEQVVARWSFSGAARRVTIATASQDGVLLPYSWPVRPATTGALTFTVPLSLYTVSPMVVMLVVDGQYLNAVPLRITCDNPWFFTPRAERCPSVPIKPSPAAMQDFEGGRMIWIGNRDTVFVFYNPGTASSEAGRWVTFEDNFDDGEPETDPAITPPAGRSQPRRGFGLVWRTQPGVRGALGWALSEERGYTACIGGGFGGWKSFVSYLNDADGRIMELKSYYMPTTWSAYVPGEPVIHHGCEG